MDKPKISIIIPCRNEADHIENALCSILKQEKLNEHCEIIVADGMSDDGTRSIIKKVAAKNERIRLIDNPKNIVSTGLNAAIRVADGEVIIRMDCHSEYEKDYVLQCVAALKETGADNVGGPCRAKSRGYLQSANSLAFKSPFSSGGPGSRNTEYEGGVDSVYLGCWRKTFLEKIGLFDEELVRNQDDELNLRTTRSGGTIWQTPKIKSWYYPRSSLTALFKQYLQYGYWKVRVIQKHKIPASIRHLIPGGFIGALLFSALLSIFFQPAKWVLFSLIAVYLAANLCASVVTCRKPGYWKYLPIMPVIFGCYHWGYGIGFWIGIIDFIVLKKSGRNAFSSLSRTSSNE